LQGFDFLACPFFSLSGKLEKKTGQTKKVIRLTERVEELFPEDQWALKAVMGDD